MALKHTSESQKNTNRCSLLLLPPEENVGYYEEFRVSGLISPLVANGGCEIVGDYKTFKCMNMSDIAFHKETACLQ